MAPRWNPRTKQYEDPSAPVATPAATPARPVRKKPNINPTQAAAQGWGLLQSPRPLEQAGFNAAKQEYGNTPTDAEITNWFNSLGTGTGTGPTTAQKRAGGLQAADILMRAGQRGRTMYNQQANEFAQQLQDLYNPLFAQKESTINEQQKAALDFLSSQYGGNQQAINQATQQALAAIPAQSTAYQNVPIVNLQQEQNPLMAALGAYGASGQAAQTQSAADAQVAQQLADLVKGSAGQMSAAQQAVLDAARSDVQTGGSSALQQLALAKQAQEAGINAQKMQAMNDLIGAGTTASVDVANARQALMSKGIESLLGGMTDAATQRAKTIEAYGPAPKKKSKVKK